MNQTYYNSLEATEETGYNLAEPPPGKKWSGKNPVPKIGDKVRINFNQLGSGVVRSYFFEHGYLGILVKLDNPPEWKRKQHPPGSKYHGVAHVFGAEIEIKEKS